MSEEKFKRVFFALWPDPAVRKLISQSFERSSYRQQKSNAYKPNNLHITLHFLGNVSSSQYDCIIQQAKAVALKPFSLKLDRFGNFGRARVLWLGPSQVPGGLSQLHEQLGEALQPCGVNIEQREYRPHVTLMRKFKHTVESSEVEAVEWTVKQFALVESIQTPSGVSYTPLCFFS